MSGERFWLWAQTQGPFFVLLVALGLWMTLKAWPQFVATQNAILNILATDLRDVRGAVTELKEAVDRLAARIEESIHYERRGR